MQAALWPPLGCCMVWVHLLCLFLSSCGPFFASLLVSAVGQEVLLTAVAAGDGSDGGS